MTRTLSGIVILAITMVVLVTNGRSDERLEALEERAFREAATLAAPSIVRIDTVGGLDVVGKMLSSSGPTSGVVVGEEGWIITSSFNFASKPASILVTTADGQRRPAKLVASDNARMLTLLKVEANGLTPLAPAPGNQIAVGDWSIALGQTYEQAFPNMSVGIISAVGRIWGRAVQTDAKVSPSNYGGPLVDVQGRGIGVLVPLSPEETGETAGVEWYDSGIGFAIPLEDIHAVLPRLQSGEDLKPGLMGVGFADRSPISGAAVVTRLRPGSPAGEAGIKEGDTIVEVDGQPVARVPHLRHILGRRYAGEELSLKLKRDAETIETTLTLAADLTAYERPFLGVLPARGPQSDDVEAGAEVRFVLPESPAAAAGIERGDRIISVNDSDVSDAESLDEFIGHLHSGDVAAIGLMRDGNPVEVEATLLAMTGKLPESLPTVEIPAPQPVDDAPPTGRLVETLGGDQQRAYWAYVPDGYNDTWQYGLVLWLHPPGDTMEGDVLKAWRTHCQRRGLILLGPKTSRPAGWTPADLDFVNDLVEEFQERYTIDPTRIVLHTSGGSAEIGAGAVFRQRQTFRGLSLWAAPLRVPPPPTDPDSPLQFHFVVPEEAAEAEAIDRGIEALESLKFPVTRLPVQATGELEMTADSVAPIAMWIDALDRI